MSHNTSHAVMAQRTEPHDSLDDFPTPPWAARALLHYVLRGDFSPKREHTAWEPACNRGAMVKPLREFFRQVLATDVHDYGAGFDVADFLFPGTHTDSHVDWIISNPPFRLAEQFIKKARDEAAWGCAFLVRTVFLETVGRYERLFRHDPPTYVAIFTERVPMVKGRLDRAASTATSYSWLAWVNGLEPQAPLWIPPCRAKLERDSDYPEAT